MRMKIAWMFGLALLTILKGGAADEDLQKWQSEQVARLMTLIDGVELVDVPFDDALEVIRKNFKKASGKDLILERIEPQRLGLKPTDLGMDEFPDFGEVRITLHLNPTAVIETLRNVVQLAQHEIVFWGDRLLVVPRSAVPMRLTLIRLDGKTAGELSDHLSSSNPVAVGDVEPGTEGYIRAFKNPEMKNRAFADLAKFFQSKGLQEPTQREGAFASLMTDAEGVSFLVAFNRPGDLWILEESLKKYHGYEPDWKLKLADELAAKTGWERVEACLELIEHDRSDLLPDELELLLALSHSFSVSGQWKDWAEIEADEIDDRKEALREKMREAADRLIEALRFEEQAWSLIPQSRNDSDPFGQ